MDPHPPTLESLLAEATSGVLSPATFNQSKTALGLSDDALHNLVAITVARRFLDAQLSYIDADAVMNAMWSLMISDAAMTTYPSPAYYIFEAFDAGEFPHTETPGHDPVQQYTIPALRKILSTL